jgi:hypothetical protein
MSAATLDNQMLTRDRQIDVDDKGAVDKATIISALQASGDADYDVVRSNLGPGCTDDAGQRDIEERQPGFKWKGRARGLGSGTSYNLMEGADM